MGRNDANWWYIIPSIYGSFSLMKRIWFGKTICILIYRPSTQKVFVVIFFSVLVISMWKRIKTYCMVSFLFMSCLRTRKKESMRQWKLGWSGDYKQSLWKEMLRSWICSILRKEPRFMSTFQMPKSMSHSRKLTLVLFLFQSAGGSIMNLSY